MAMSVTYTTFNGQIVYENRGGVESYYAPDTLGSTAALLNASGVVTDTFTYQPYGEIASHVGSSVTPFTYCGTLGYYTDTANSSIYVRARYYRPNLARWQTVDPLWPEQSKYIYCEQDPIGKRDPSGRQGSGQGTNFSNSCAVKLCAEHTLPWGIPIASHKFICVEGPSGGCSAGLYPDGPPFGPGHLGNMSDSCGGSMNDVTCELISNNCEIAQSVCKCVKIFYKSPPPYVFGVHDCYTFPNDVLGCACGQPGMSASARAQCIYATITLLSQGHFA